MINRGLEKLIYCVVLTVISCKSPEPITEFNQPVEEVIVEETSNNEEYFNENTLKYSDFIYRDDITTVQLYNKGVNQLSAPIYELGSSFPLVLAFDEFATDFTDYFYTLIHCNANWQPSGLTEPEFMEGFYPDLIRNYQHSFNTIVDYNHYELEIPNETLSLIKSGNYVLYVYEVDENDPVITKRFVVNENRIGVTPFVKRSSVVEHRNYKQEIDFDVDLKNLAVSNPYRDITVVVRQNERWDNAIYDLKPIFIRNTILEYNHERTNDFWGGNEFRKFDLKSVQYQTEDIKLIKREEDGYHAYLEEDDRRSYKQYFFDYDIHGKYYIKNDDGFDDILEPEYIYVHFSLPWDTPIENGEIYIFGQLSERNATEKFKMSYNYDKWAYELVLLLKQGYYNYLYAIQEDGKDFLDTKIIEGTHAETNNEYSVYVYYRDRSLDYDRLVGIKYFNSDNF